MFSFIKNAFVLLFATLLVGSFFYYLQTKNTNNLPNTNPPVPFENGQLGTAGDFQIDGDIYLSKDSLTTISPTGKVLTIDPTGKIVLVADQEGVTETNIITQSTNPFTEFDSMFGLGLSIPEAKLHIFTQHSGTAGLAVQGEVGQTNDLTKWKSSGGQDIARLTALGKIVLDNNADHQLEIRPSGNTGFLSSVGGSIFIENSSNIGTGIGIFSNAGADALGNMINVKVDNPAFNQAAFFMDYDGISNAVEIKSNTNDSSSNALSITNNNTLDSAIGVIGKETGRGTIKITHIGTGGDANASGLSIDLKGTGTQSQGIFVDATEGGTTGALLKLRNNTTERFVVDNNGALSIGVNGTDTSITKTGNVSGDEFFVGTTGAFRVQRSVTDSEAFRTQIAGDTQGRWLGTADGKLKFGDGASLQDAVLERIGAGHMRLDADYTILSQATNNDVLTLTASDGSRLGRFTETSGGAGWFEVDNSSGTAVALFRADGGDSYINAGNFGLATTAFDSTAIGVFTIGNGTAPAASVTDAVQLWAEDITSSSELRVRDEGGTVTTLSPHNFTLIPTGKSEDLAWSFYSENGDRAINADMTKALRILESLSGEKLIYIKNLKTGEYQDIAKTLADSKEEEENFLNTPHVSFDEKLISFLNQVVFTAKAKFIQSVEFMANATFNGHIAVNADTAGSITIPANTQKFKVIFTSQFEKNPLIYLSTNTQELNFSIKNISTTGFEVEILNPSSAESQFQWIALMPQGEQNKLEILEISNSNNSPEISD